MRKLILLGATIFLGVNSFSQAPGCPNISVSSNDTLDCDNNCVTLGSEVLKTGETTDYIVGSVAYAPPFSFSGGTALFVGQDDIWSSVINLPFNFCFYGNTYNSLVVGANGVISFNTGLAGTTCDWQFSDAVPSSNLMTNAIFGAYHDIDPSVATAGNINYAVIGTSPCRTFVVNFNDIKQYQCTNLSTTQQIVLYEATNVVEIYVQDKPTCSGWNDGNALIGMQNSTGSAGITPPGRNTGSWSATNEAWRFTPDGAPNYIVNWYESGALIGTGDSLTVCPPVTTTFTAEVQYTNCDGNLILDSGDVVVYVSDSIMVVDVGADTSICVGDTVMLGGNPTAYGGSGTYTYSWTPGTEVSDSTIANPTVVPSATQTYYLTVDDGVQCIISDSVTVTVHNYPVANAGPDDTLTCQNLIISLDGSGSSSFGDIQWSTLGGNILSGDTTLAPQVDQPGLYVLEMDNMGCMDTDTAEIFQDAAVPVVDAGVDTALTCLVDTIQLSGFVSGSNIIYYWTGPSIISGDSTLTPIVIGGGVYTLTAIDTTNSCQMSSTITIDDNRNLPVVDAGPDVNLTCVIDSIYLDGSGSETGTDISYQWTTSDGNILLGSDSIHSLIDMPGTYVLTVFNSSNSCTSFDIVTVGIDTILPITTAGADTSLNCATITTGVPLNGTGSQSGTNISYTWTTLDGNIVAGANSNFPLVNAAGTYTLTVTNSINGCQDTDDAMVIVDTVPPTAEAGPDAFINCYNNVAILDGTSSSSGVSITYQWAGPFVTSGGNTNSPTVSGAGTYILTVTNTSNECVSTDDVNVTADILVPGANAGSTDTLCSGTSLSLNGSTTTGDVTYWTTIDGNIVSGDSTLNPVINSGGTYTLTTINSVNGCQSASNVYINELFVSTNLNADPTSGLAPLEVDFSNTGIADSSYWDFGNGETLGDTSATSTASITYEEQGSYVVTLTSINGQCVATQQVVIEVLGTSFLIVPNVFTPNGDGQNDVFEFMHQNISELSCVIFNRWGKKVAEINAPEDSWNGTVNGGGDASDGTYFYLIKATGNDEVDYDLKGTVSLIR